MATKLFWDGCDKELTKNDTFNVSSGMAFVSPTPTHAVQHNDFSYKGELCQS